MFCCTCWQAHLWFPCKAVDKYADMQKRKSHGGADTEPAQKRAKKVAGAALDPIFESGPNHSELMQTIGADVAQGWKVDTCLPAVITKGAVEQLDAFKSLCEQNALSTLSDKLSKLYDEKFKKCEGPRIAMALSTEDLLKVQ
eukprot:5406729-Amphidinium_carterae.2